MSWHSQPSLSLTNGSGVILLKLEKNEIELILYTGQREVIVPPKLEGGHSGGD